MARAQRKPRRWPDTYSVANLLIWTVSYAENTARTFMDYPDTAGTMAVRRLCVCLFAVALPELMRFGLARTEGQPFLRRMGVGLLLSILGSAAYGVANHFAFYVILTQWQAPAMRFWDVWQLMSITIWVFLACAVVYFAISYDAEARDKTVKLLSAQSLALDAQNRMLRYQINPHFLFNTLNALSALILARENGRAEQVTLALSRFLRFSLERQPTDKITLADELEAQRQYLLIERVRFGDRLSVCEAVSPEARECRVPSLILQPLVENAVKYGVARTTRPVTITIAAERRGDRLAISVTDDGEPGESEAPVRLGVGLENVRQRLQVLYGAAASLEARPDAPLGFRAILETPAET